MRNVILAPTLLALTVLSLAQPAIRHAHAQGAGLSPDVCEGIVQSQAFFARAKSKCSLRADDSALVQQAKACSTVLNAAQMKQLAADGAETFDDNESEQGHAAACKTVLDRMPAYMRK